MRYCLPICLCALLFSFYGCDKLKEKTYSTTMLFTFPVSVDAGTGEATIDLQGLVDVLATNADLNKVKDGIKEFKKLEVSWKIWEYYDDPANVFNGYIGFSNKLMETPGVQIALNDVSLQSSMDNPQSLKLSFASVDANKIYQYLLDSKALKLYLHGSLSQRPATFKVGLSISVDCTAESK
jgi:hypothetical protein